RCLKYTGEQFIEAQLGRNRLGNRQELPLLALLLFELLDQSSLVESVRRLAVDCLHKGHIYFGERPRALVQHLSDAHHWASLVAQPHGKQIVGAVACPAVYLAVEARVAVGIGDNLGYTRAEY